MASGIGIGKRAVAKKVAFRFVTATFWLAYAWFAYLILASSLPYFGEAARFHIFLIENETKRELAQTTWYMLALRVHVVGGVLCLAAILIQFSPFILKKFRGLHRWSGRIYGIAALLLVCLPGMPMSLFAKGGAAGQFGFLLLGAMTFGTTWMGIKTARQRKFAAHREWMIRSFALVASAITFRLLQIGLYYFTDLADNTNYVLCLYASTFGNLTAAEFTIAYTRKPKSKPEPKTHTENETDNYPRPLRTSDGGSSDPATRPFPS